VSVWIEVHLKGGGACVMDAGMIAGCARKGDDLFTRGTTDAPLSVFIRGGGETLEVIDESVGSLISRIIYARQAAKNAVGATDYFDRITALRPEEDEDAAPAAHAVAK
jgi:hypothetical protein